jgi:DNA-binding beta-propeller fold protein YncE
VSQVDGQGLETSSGGDAKGEPDDGSDVGEGGDGPDGGTTPSGVPIFYVTSDEGSLSAYSEVSWQLLHAWTGLPITDGVRGADVDPVGGVLYIAHGGDGGQNGTGSLLAWSLIQNKVIYDIALGYGVDQLAYGDGNIYMPEGEASTSTTWHVLTAATGSQTGAEIGGASPHNTISRNRHRYYGGRYANDLVTLGTGAGAIGPSPSNSSGVRPFTINAAETRAWITWTDYRGFSIGDVASGALLASINFGPLPSGWSQTTASHGVSLSPDGSEVYVLDMTQDSVRVYDASDSPQLVATVPLLHGIYGGTESPCAYDCAKVGWLLHSRNGRYVFVGDSGDVIDTKARTVVTYLAPLHENRHGFVEVDWTSWPSGVPVGTTTHFGMGY